MDVPNPEMRMRHQVGRSKPTKRGLKKCLLNKVKQGAVQRPSWKAKNGKYVGGRLQDLTTLAGPKKGAEETPLKKGKGGLKKFPPEKTKKYKTSKPSVGPEKREEHCTHQKKHPHICRVPTPPCDWYPRQRYVNFLEMLFFKQWSARRVLKI